MENNFNFKAGDVGTVRALLDTGVKVDVKGADQGTPLNWASRGTQAGADMVRLLLSRGAAIESQDSSKSTPLVQAVHVSFNFLIISMKTVFFALVFKNLIFIYH